MAKGRGECRSNTTDETRVEKLVETRWYWDGNRGDDPRRVDDEGGVARKTVKLKKHDS